VLKESRIADEYHLDEIGLRQPGVVGQKPAGDPDLGNAG
jgi:hypothetical protein